jgi:hypothetical protein
MATFGALVHVMAEVGKSTEALTLPDGTRLLLLSYGARALVLCAAGSEENFFWTNPPLDEIETARQLFAHSGWHNTGGGRTWVAPELDVFFPAANSDHYWQPRALDMSDYAVAQTGGGVELSRSMSLHLARPDRDVKLKLGKWFGPAANPLRHERDMAAAVAAAEYAGYTERVTLQSLDAAADRLPAVGIWNLLQLPAGGEMLVPLYSGTVPQKCFGDIPANRVTIEERLLRVRADFSGSHKIAVKGAALCGRTGYVYGQRDAWSLVVRNFFVNPSGEYIDVQRHDPTDYGYAFQMCRVDEPDFGSFCEMEYHAPALGACPEPARSEEVSQVWAFRGTRETIDHIARKLLGAGPCSRDAT